MINWKVGGRKWSRPIIRYINLLEGLKETTEPLIQESQSPRRDTSPRRPQNEANHSTVIFGTSLLTITCVTWRYSRKKILRSKGA